MRLEMLWGNLWQKRRLERRAIREFGHVVGNGQELTIGSTQLLNATLDPKRGPLKASNTSKFLAAQNRLTDGTRSMPSSPALSGIGSPSVAPTSVPASQVAAEQAKATRKPIIHILALGPLSEKDLKERLLYADLDDNLFEAALNKVADKDETTKIFTLRQKNWKDLDVWCFNYDTEEDRQAVVDAAVKIYDRMRIPPNDDEWERLKPLETRGNGTSLSKIQARIAQGPIPRTPVPNADSGLDTPAREGEEASNKAINRVKKETKPRSSSQPPAAKAKKVSEKEAQTKRILTTKKKPTVAAPRKELPSKVGGAKPLSNLYVNSDSEEDTRVTKKAQPAKPAPAKSAPIAKAKRAREDEVASDASMAKKARISTAPRDLKEKPAALPPKPKRAREEEVTASEPSQPIKKKARPSDASQNSAIIVKSKGTSPQKSSPLASSPPTNASEFNSSSSDSSTPRHLQNHTLTHKRNTSSASSTTSSTNRVSAHILQMAAEYKVYHPSYLKLYQSLSVVEERDRDPEKWDDLMEMHKRLAAMKREIYESSRAS